LHVDFQIVRRDEVISAEVPIVLVGESKSVEQEKGIVEQLLTSLTVNATPASIPSNIEVDISEMTLGESIRVGDLPLPSGVTTDVSADDLVVMASATRAVAEEEAAEGEGVEGEDVATESGGAEGAGSDSARADGASGSEEG
jgi:large subunit ribosomal protein L25